MWAGRKAVSWRLRRTAGHAGCGGDSCDGGGECERGAEWPGEGGRGGDVCEGEMGEVHGRDEVGGQGVGEGGVFLAVVVRGFRFVAMRGGRSWGRGIWIG